MTIAPRYRVMTIANATTTSGAPPGGSGLLRLPATGALVGAAIGIGAANQASMFAQLRIGWTIEGTVLGNISLAMGWIRSGDIAQSDDLKWTGYVPMVKGAENYLVAVIRNNTAATAQATLVGWVDD